MNNEDRTYLILKYGDYHSNPELIEEFDIDILDKIYKEVSDGDNPLLIRLNLRSRIGNIIRIFDDHKELIAATDKVLLEHEK